MQNRRLNLILLFIVVILLIPLVAMQFTDEVNWTLSDFVIGGALLLSVGLLIEFVMRKIKKKKHRIALILGILLIFLLIWAELAVGILGTPLSGM